MYRPISSVGQLGREAVLLAREKGTHSPATILGPESGLHLLIEHCGSGMITVVLLMESERGDPVHLTSATLARDRGGCGTKCPKVA